MKFLSNKERGAAIRAELKKLGYNSKQISVRSGNCGYSCYSSITIKDLSIDIKLVERACLKFKDIDYDERTGEILEGGNTYIRVDYDYKTLVIAENEQMPKVEKIIAELENRQIPIKKGNVEYRLCKDSNGFYVTRYEAGNYCGMEINTRNVHDYKMWLARAFATNFA